MFGQDNICMLFYYLTQLGVRGRVTLTPHLEGEKRQTNYARNMILRCSNQNVHRVFGVSSQNRWL